MKYGEKSFSVAVGGESYRSGWDRIFGKPEAMQRGDSFDCTPPDPAVCPWCDATEDLVDVEEGGKVCRDGAACNQRYLEQRR